MRHGVPAVLLLVLLTATLSGGTAWGQGDGDANERLDDNQVPIRGETPSLDSRSDEYRIGRSMEIILTDPGLNLNSEVAERHSLDSIKWDSDGGEFTMGDDSIIKATPSDLVETGPDTGVFQTSIIIPREVKYEYSGGIGTDVVHPGETVELTYTNGDISATHEFTVFDEKPIIDFDKMEYAWIDRVLINITAHALNFDPLKVDVIGDDFHTPVQIFTRPSDKLNEYRL